MKRKRLDRDIWTSITSKEYIQRDVHDSEFSGVVALLYLRAVTPPSVWQSPYGQITVCETGMKWFQFLPEGEHYLLTAMIDETNKINVIYIDIIANSGIQEDGVAFFDDLYLDLVVYPNGNILIDDREELNAALRSNDISKEQYDLAQQTQNKLLNGLLADVNLLRGFCLRYLVQFEGSVLP